jgi:hypothetical protein
MKNKTSFKFLRLKKVNEREIVLLGTDFVFSFVKFLLFRCFYFRILVIDPKMASKGNVCGNSKILVRLKGCFRPPLNEKPSKCKTMSKNQTDEPTLQKRSTIHKPLLAQSLPEMKAIAKPAPGCLLRADNTPGSRIVCQNPIPVLGQDQAGSEGLITDETCSSSKNVLTLTLNEGNFKNDLQLMKMNCKTATRTRKIVNWSFVSKFKDFISAESSVSDGWRLRKNQCGSSYYKCCISRCEASMRIRTIDHWNEKFWVLEKNDFPHLHIHGTRGIDVEAKIYIQHLMELGINKPKLILFHIQQNVDKIKFPIPTKNQINSYIYKK